MGAQIIFPIGTKQRGNQSVLVLQTVAVPTAVKLATEIGATDTLNLTMLLYKGAGFNPAGETATGEAPLRLGESKAREEAGDTTFSIPEIQYTHDPQGDDTVPANIARATLLENDVLYFLERLGPSAETVEYAATQRYRLHHARLGPQIWGRTGDTPQDEFCINQRLFYVTPPVDGVIAA